MRSYAEPVSLDVPMSDADEARWRPQPRSRLVLVGGALAVLAGAALILSAFTAAPGDGEVRSRLALLGEGGGAGAEVVPAQNVILLPEGSIQSGMQQVLGTVTGIRVTGELQPVGPAPPSARVTELAPRRAVVPQVTGQLEAVSPQETAATAASAAAAAPAVRTTVGGAVQAAVEQAGTAAEQATAAVRSDLQPGPTEAVGIGGQHLSAAHLSFNGGVFWQAAQAAATDKSQIHKLAARMSGLGTRESQLSAQEKDLGAAVSRDGLEDTALTSVVKHNRLAINDLTEQLRRQKLIDEGQYGILYRRLTAVADRLRKVDTDEKESKKAILRAQATLHMGNQMLATAGRGWQPAVQGPPAPQAYHAAPPQNAWPQMQYPQYQQPPAPQHAAALRQASAYPASPPPSPSPSQLHVDMDCARAGVFCPPRARDAGKTQHLGDWTRLALASEHGAKEASRAPVDAHHRTGRTATIHKAFEDMDPEQLMSGYHLAGGAHPGQHLGSARRSWFQRHLADVHRQSGSVLGNGGDEHLRQKRAQITKQLLQLASAPDKRRRVSHGGEPERLGVAERTFAAEERAAQERHAAGGTRPAQRRRRSETDRLNALTEREVLAHGVRGSDAFSHEEDSLGRDMGRRPRADDDHDVRDRERPAEGGHRHAMRESRRRGAQHEAEREAAARRVWSDSLESRAAAGFAAASKARLASPYKAAMTGSVFEHFLRHPNPRQLSGQALTGGVPSGEMSTASSQAAMIARAGVRTHDVEGHDIPSGYTGFAASF